MEALVTFRMKNIALKAGKALAGIRLATALSALVLVLLAGSALAAAPSAVTHIFLIQNSGWMEPFYSDPASGFKSLVSDGAEKINALGRPLVVASFNQSIGENRSPRLLFRGNDLGAAQNAVNGIQVAKKPGSIALADTDFMEAVVGSITEYSSGRPAVIWIFTNNKNSPNNSPETSAKNSEFYNWVRAEKNIPRIFSYSFPMPVKGKYQANGIMVYALAYGAPAETELQALVAKNIPFKETPARLKPLDSDAVTFVPRGVAKQSKVAAALGPDGNSLILKFSASGRPETALLAGVFRNDFFPYDIRAADVALKVAFQGDTHGIQSAISPSTIADVPAGGESAPLAVQIQIPPLPGIWSHPELIFQNGYSVKGQMEFSLANQQLELSPIFRQQMNQLFPGDPLPEIFTPEESAKHSTTIRPVVIKVSYPVWPLILLMIAAFLLIACGFWLAAVMSMTRKYTVSVNGIKRSYALKAFGSSTLYSDQGESIGTLKRGLGKPTAQLNQGRTDKVSIM